MEEGEEITGQGKLVMLIWGKEINLVVAFFFIQVALNCKLSIIAEQYVILFFFFFLPHLQTCMSGIK